MSNTEALRLALDALENVAVDLAIAQQYDLAQTLGNYGPQKHEAAKREREQIEAAAAACRAALAQPAASGEPAPTRADLIAALQFYAGGGHFNLSETSAWDTVSGEPQNWWCDEAGTATIEDGSLAKMALAGDMTAGHFAALERGEDVCIGSDPEPMSAQPAPAPAASGEPVAAECDSPKLCALNGACAGQYGTKQQCAIAQPAPALSQDEQWNRAGREPYKFHPQASHVSPDYRDGWNAAIDAVARSAQPAPARVPQGWVCSKCGTHRFKEACPLGHSAALTGQCPMVGAS